MSILFLAFLPAKKRSDGHVRPEQHSYIWIGLPIEVIVSISCIVNINR